MSEPIRPAGKGPDGIERGAVLEQRVSRSREPRLPPGQTRTEKWPVLHYGSVPRFDRSRWDFRIYGEVSRPLRFTYEELLARPRVELVCDIHCVTRWSRFGTVFEGAPVAPLLAEAEPLPTADFAVVHGENGYTTNLPVESLRDEEALLADWADGSPLTPEHGHPLRLVIPDRYFWKSAKWVRAIQLVPNDEPGFWERAGYHNNADPWREERFGE